MSYPPTQSGCERDFRLYADTVAVLSAIKKFFDDNQTYGAVIGIEPALKSADGRRFTPDLSVIYGTSYGIAFEFKWSLPKDLNLLEKELLEVAKYVEAKYGWNVAGGSVDRVSVILVFHADDCTRAIKMVQDLAKELRGQLLASDLFAIWTWDLAIDKEHRKEQLRITHCYGKTIHEPLMQRFEMPGGFVTPEDVLRYLRYQYKFVKQEPPLQYTIGVLAQNILPFFQTKPEREQYDIKLDWIAECCSKLYPQWPTLDGASKQIKRSWVVKALKTMVVLGIADITKDKDTYRIPIPTIVSRKNRSLEEIICRKILKYLKRPRPPPVPTKRKTLIPRTDDRRISEFLKC